MTFLLFTRSIRPELLLMLSNINNRDDITMSFNGKLNAHVFNIPDSRKNRELVQDFFDKCPSPVKPPGRRSACQPSENIK